MNEFIDIEESRKEEFNEAVTHPLQSYEWGEFRKKTGVKVIRKGRIHNGKIADGFTLTLHKVPKTRYYIGYLPKGNSPTEEILNELKSIGEKENCIFIQLEPNLTQNSGIKIQDSKLKPAAHPLFTKYTFVLDLTPNETDLMAKMHSKTRYNIRVAEKHGVIVSEDNSEESFEEYLKLMNETTSRQGFYAHTNTYHKNLFESLSKKAIPNTLSYHLFNAKYKPENPDERNTKNDELTLTSWVLFVFKDHLYYPYGASSRQFREVMANNEVCWEAIKFGKKHGLSKFDMWGALGPEPDKTDPWYGFHRFKEGYGAELVEFVGSYDLIIKPSIYELYKVMDKLRWGILKMKKKVGM